MSEKTDPQGKWRFHWDQVNSLKKINFLKNIGELETVKNYKQLSFRRLRVAHGDSILDIGCGLAYDASLLANEVSPTGHIFALDNDLGILSASKELPRSHAFPLGFIQANATELCFSDNQFDGCRVDRVLQHLPEPRKAFEEMVRVTKQQGWIVAIEPDWDTAIVYSQSKRKITRTVLNNWADTRKSGWIGRELPILFKEYKLRDIRVEYVPIIDSLYTYDWENDFMGFVSSANHAAATGMITALDAKQWIEQLKRNSQNKIFLLTWEAFL